MWYKDKDTVTLDDVDKELEPVTLSIGASISGTVQKKTVNNPAAPLPGAWIDVYDTDEEFLGYAISGSEGDYTVNGLPNDGRIKVLFHEENFQNQGIGRSLWYDQAENFEEADEVTVDSIDIDALFEPGKIFGTVEGEDGKKIEGIAVQFYDIDGNLIKTALTNTDGEYSIEGLSSGIYRVFFNAFNIPENYVSMWYKDKNTITINDEDEELELDLVILSLGVSISGTVQKKTVNNPAVPLPGAWIDVYDMNKEFLGYAISGSEGSYTVNGLPNDGRMFKVLFHEENFQNEGTGRSLWYNQKKEFEEADEVPVDSTDIDALFEPSEAAPLLPMYKLLLL
jgi:hypothetical protein